MFRFMNIKLTVLVVIGCACCTYGQVQETSQDVVEQPATVDNTTPSPLPGEEVMRPTKHGLRLTPGLARGMIGRWVRESLQQEKGISMTEDQSSYLTDTISRRMMRLGNAHGKEVRDFTEYMIESMANGNGEVSPERSQEFGRRAKSVMPAFRELFERSPDEALSVFTDEQRQQLRQSGDEARRILDRWETEMDKWAEGGIEKPENPFDKFEEWTDDAEDKSGQSDKTDTPKKSQKKRTADNRASWEITRFGPQEWKRYLSLAAKYLDFDEGQLAEGQKLLDDYTTQAKAIMTDEWREQAKENRSRYFFQQGVDDLKMGPLLYELDADYKKLVEPVKQMGRQFRREVLALATDEQREKVLTELREFVVKHGMTDEEIDGQKFEMLKKSQ